MGVPMAAGERKTEGTSRLGHPGPARPLGSVKGEDAAPLRTAILLLVNLPRRRPGAWLPGEHPAVVAEGSPGECPVI